MWFAGDKVSLTRRNKATINRYLRYDEWENDEWKRHYGFKVTPLFEYDKRPTDELFAYLLEPVLRRAIYNGKEYGSSIHWPDHSSYCAGKALGHPYCPVWLLRLAIQSPNPCYARNASRNRECPEELLVQYYLSSPA